MRRRIALSLVCSALLALAACGGGGDPGEELVTPDAGQTPSGQTSASMVVTNPKPGGTVPIGSHTVTVSVQNFRLVKDADGKPDDEEGHLIYYLDVGEVPTKSGEPAFTDEGTYHATHEPAYMWPEISEGQHTISVQLVRSDDTPLSQPRVVRVTFNVRGTLEPTRPPGQTREPEPSHD